MGVDVRCTACIGLGSIPKIGAVSNRFNSHKPVNRLAFFVSSQKVIANMTQTVQYRIEQITPSVRANLDRKLYLISAGDGGFSCLGFDVCQEKSEAYGEWLDKRGITIGNPFGPVNPFVPGTASHYQRYCTIISEIRKYCEKHRVRCDVDLEPQLIGLEGKRVEVTDRHGEVRRFQVGKSTGFIPIHLELPNRRSSGGPAVTGAPFAEVRVIY